MPEKLPMMALPVVRNGKQTTVGDINRIYENHGSRLSKTNGGKFVEISRLRDGS